MKLLNQVIFAALMGTALTLVACANGDGGGVSQDPNAAAAAGYATTPQPCNTPNVINNPNCLTGGYVNGQYQYGYQYGQAVLPQSWYYGAWQFPSQWQPQVGNCGCQSGYQAIYHQSYGMACAPTAYFNPQNYNSGYNNGGYGYGGVSSGLSYYLGAGIYLGFQFNWGASYGPSVNNQNLNIPQTYYGNSCTGNSAPVQGCDTRNYNSCGGQYSGYICQPAGGGSSIGICVQDYRYYRY